jgi:hypothetical protein
MAREGYDIEFEITRLARDGHAVWPTPLGEIPPPRISTCRLRQIRLTICITARAPTKSRAAANPASIPVMPRIRFPPQRKFGERALTKAQFRLMNG